MVRKQVQRAPNPILDEKTSELLFGREDVVDFDRMVKSLIKGTVSIDELARSPISDIGAINERITTIGDLVVNPEARRRFQGVVGAFGFDYEGFYHKIQEYVETQRADPYRKERVASELNRLIGEVAEAAANLPPSIGANQFRPGILREAALGYNRMMGERHDSGRAFFEYIINLNNRIEEITSAEKEEKIEKPDFWMRRQDDGISYEQLREVLDMKEIVKFKQHINQAKAVSSAVSPYLQQAEEAVKGQYCEPIIVPKEENCLIIKNGKNPRWRGAAVPNHTQLDSGQSVEVLEGVNNGGKTFDMRKAFTIAIAALSGSWVPAGYVKVSVRDYIVMRQKGKGDVISAMQQDCRNVREATPPDDQMLRELSPPRGKYWLVGLDETFTSTERRGGRALLYGLISYVLEQGHSLLITSSHYLGLDSDFTGDGRVVFNHFPFQRKRTGKKRIEIVFPYTKQQGPLRDVRYALAVAVTRNFDSKVIEYANDRMHAKNK